MLATIHYKPMMLKLLNRWHHLIHNIKIIFIEKLFVALRYVSILDHL